MLGATVLFFNSCVSTNKSFQSSPVIAGYVTLDPIKADITIDESKKLDGESSTTYFLFFRVSGDRYFADGIHYNTDMGMFSMIKNRRLNRIRSAAAYNALRAGDYDVLVHPKYEMKTENYLGLAKNTALK